MSAADESARVVPYDLEDIAPDGPLREAFIALQAPWTERGVSRWLGLLTPASSRPLLVNGAWSREDEPRLVGTMVGLWHPTVLDRFDTVFEPEATPSLSADARPDHGCWHFISVTIAQGWQGRGLGRRMVRHALQSLRECSPKVIARTLSPALGLADALGTSDGASVSPAVLEAAVHGLPIVRFHCANGATLDAILPGSRSDDLASARVNLRFAYELPDGPVAS